MKFEILNFWVVDLYPERHTPLKSIFNRVLGTRATDGLQECLTMVNMGVASPLRCS